MIFQLGFKHENVALLPSTSMITYDAAYDDKVTIHRKKHNKQRIPKGIYKQHIPISKEICYTL